jgi:hypothetical protein
MFEMIYHLLAPFPFAVFCDAEILKQLCLRLVDMTFLTLGDVPPPWGVGGFIDKVAILLGELVSC